MKPQDRDDRSIVRKCAGSILALIGAGTMLSASGVGAASLALETSNPKLERSFQWAVQKALSYVQTGKTGVVDGHERQRQSVGSVKYIPSYWAGYTWRTAFYSRDYCHQAAGAHLLDLQQENLSMLRAFAGSATAGRPRSGGRLAPSTPSAR